MTILKAHPLIFWTFEYARGLHKSVIEIKGKMLLHFNAMLLLLFSLLTRVSGVKVNVLEFNQEKYKNYAKGNKANFKMGSEMKSSKVSVCFRFQPRYDESIALFHRNHHLQFNLVTLKNGFGFVKINRVGRMFDLKMKNFDLFKWHHFCFTVHQKKVFKEYKPYVLMLLRL